MKLEKEIKEIRNLLKKRYSGSLQGKLESLERLQENIKNNNVVKSYFGSSNWDKRWIYMNLVEYDLIKDFPSIEEEFLNYEIDNTKNRVYNSINDLLKDSLSYIFDDNGFLEFVGGNIRNNYYINKIKNKDISKILEALPKNRIKKGYRNSFGSIIIE